MSDNISRRFEFRRRSFAPSYTREGKSAAEHQRRERKNAVGEGLRFALTYRDTAAGVGRKKFITDCPMSGFRADEGYCS